ncbi:Acyl-CoA dehydrogenase [Archaeoglobus fulgidus DSM 8774]|uniref:Acyl-CoA dehydrogenase n=1 Tax=Archaeoglobus fulgidus DSM 8774 TaxID=1344584 RepID=A0A075WFY3_ARCFL|nr:acyl-CoA dehydrogenase family protein [Archaeoglobus fulgidus]AIG99285.1 Acyl-CoA dehydrogenase [Archaeoglobus fulgidus DSM 8774]
MEMELSQEHRLFRDSLREFLAKEVEPIADERDRKGPLSKGEVLEFFAKFRKLGIGYDPESLSVYFEDPFYYGIASEEISRVWASLNVVLGMSFPVVFVNLASDQTKDAMMPKLEKNQLIGCLAATEPEAGSDTTKLKTTAELDGDEWVLNGTKTWISNATVADVALVVATNREMRMQDMFLVDQVNSPFETSELHKLGWRAAPTGEIYLRNCRVPKDNALSVMIQKALSSGGMVEALPIAASISKLYAYMSPLSAVFCLMRSGMALMATGISQAALDASITYARQRKAFGKPIGKFQLIQDMLYKMAAITESSRLLGYKALYMIQKGDPKARYMSSLAKGYACEGCVEVTYNAIQIHGGLGLSDEYPLERYFRDARVMTIPDGTTEIQKLIVGRELLGKGFSAYT